MPLTLRELKGPEIPGIFPLVQSVNPWMTRAQFNRMLEEMLEGGYRVVAAFESKEMLGISGFWLRTRFWCGKQLDLDNFVIREGLRGKGIGQALMQWLEKTAKRERCKLMVLDTYIERERAQAFYGKQGFAKTGYHMTKMPDSTTPGALPYDVDRKMK